MNDKILPSSFRDPSGFLFTHGKTLYRQVNKSYKKNFDYLISSGLYKALVNEKLLILHRGADIKYRVTEDAYKTIRPQLVPFISYPYEWCFSQLKDSALLTLKIQKRAFEFGMTLKDASSFNVQFLNGKPIFVDTLSFDIYKEGSPWIAYKQFCEHFLAPLALMSKKEVRLNQLLRIYIDGVPLELASKLLPSHTYLNFQLLSHVHLHAKSQKYFSKRKVEISKTVSKRALLSLIDNLESSVNKLKWEPKGTTWGKYYDETNYSASALAKKKKLVEMFLDKAKPKKLVWDLGANIGLFSRLASDKGILTVSFDLDPAAVEKNYLEVKKKSEVNILPLLSDLTNPSPGAGWDNKERASLTARGPAETTLALALIHHLAIANNLPFEKIAHFFAKISNFLIIEFVPKDDSNVKRLLASREDIFTKYTKYDFEREFGKYFSIKSSTKIKETKRVLYLMKRK